MEGPLPPLTKIVDDVEGVEVEVMLALKSMRCGRGCGGRVSEVGRFEQDDVMGDSVEVARDCRRFEGLGEEIDSRPLAAPGWRRRWAADLRLRRGPAARHRNRCRR